MILIVVVSISALIVAIVVALDVGPGYINDWRIAHPKKAKQAKKPRLDPKLVLDAREMILRGVTKYRQAPTIELARLLVEPPDGLTVRHRGMHRRVAV